MLRLLKTKSSRVTPLDGVELVLADLDGVVYKGAGAIPHAVESLNLTASTRRVGYVTNNAARTDETVAAHLRELGLEVQSSDVVTSPQAAMALLADLVPAGSLIMIVGGDGLVDELEKSGYRVTRSAEDDPAAVVQGFAPNVAWTDLAEAAFALAEKPDGTSIPWVATNTDWTIPVARGIAPGNGTLVSAVHLAVGRLPVVAGKPEIPIFETAFARFDTRSALFIGDRLDTDIMGANKAGIESLLVLTGIDRAKHVLAAGPKERPTYIVEDLRGLHEPYPQTVMSKDGLTATVGSARVRITGNDVMIVADGDGGIDRLRAACAVIWASGRAIFGLNVPEALYTESSR